MALVIKENCWKWESSKGSFFMKYYEDVYLATKVKMVHNQLEKIQFPNHIISEKNEDAHILKQQWYEGKSADYRKLSDQKKTLKALKALHETRNEVDWETYKLLPNYELKEKWHRRFERFIENEGPLKMLLQENYKKIVSIAANALQNIDDTNAIENPKTLLHGDVVHHNFMMGEKGVKIVDFDLACVGEYTDEIILWIHRVLPNVSYQLPNLFEQHPYLQEAKPKLQYLRFPNEVMREALFYLKCNPRQKQACYPFIQSIISEAIQHEKNLSKTIEIIQES